MIISSVAAVSPDSRPPDETRFIRVKRIPDADAAIMDVTLGMSDAVILEQPVADPSRSIWDSLLAIRPLVSVWHPSASDGKYGFLYAGEEMVRNWGHGSPPPPLHLRALRHVWLDGWAARVGALAVIDESTASQTSFPSRCFRVALRVDSLEALEQVTARPAWRLRRSLRARGYRGPKRFLTVARGLLAWERARLGRESIEAIAHALGFSSLPAMDRSLRSLFAVAPRELRDLTDEQFWQRLRVALLSGEEEVENRKLQSERG